MVGGIYGVVFLVVGLGVVVVLGGKYIGGCVVGGLYGVV